MNHNQPYLTRYNKLGHIIWESRKTVCQCVNPKCSHSFQYTETFHVSPICPKCCGGDERREVERKHGEIEPPYKYIVFDSEGFPEIRDKAKPNAEEDRNEFRIGQLSWAVYRHDGNLEYIQNHIIQPNGYRISDSNKARRGFSYQDAVKQGKPILEAINLFQQDLARYPADKICLIAFNISHDLDSINKELLLAGQDQIDFSEYRQFCLMENTTSLCEIPSEYEQHKFQYPNLRQLHEYLFGNFSNWHNSFYDIQATARCFFELINRKYIVCEHEIGAITDKKREQERMKNTFGENERLHNLLEHKQSKLSKLSDNLEELEERCSSLEKHNAELEKLNATLKKWIIAIVVVFIPIISGIIYTLWPSENNQHTGNQANQLVIAKNTALYKQASSKRGNLVGFIQKCARVSEVKNNDGISKYDNGKWLHISYSGKVCPNQNMKGKCFERNTAGWVNAQDIETEPTTCQN
ncbi:hypothetical protein [Neisseria dentiae]|uniref:hypothetical protein n=1 Tax=Neisseria dentiae TaxID=194197 RepID=UPI00211C0389|nr:hypothetical protein [Neisseria dentiae]MCQ9325690.1 hypothetical protein [Neisseria dentiae]